jgi:hypothetical protein
LARGLSLLVDCRSKWRECGATFMDCGRLVARSDGFGSLNEAVHLDQDRGYLNRGGFLKIGHGIVSSRWKFKPLVYSFR